MNDENNATVREGAVFVVSQLRAAGYEAYLVGGCVRDRLLSRPIREYDIATGATPDQVIATFRRTVPVGVQFGVILVLTRFGEYEVATFRAEADYTDGRRPDNVRFVSAREDVLRRDFTINGLLEDPETDEIRDFVDGRIDLQNGLIRAIGDPHERFAEDHLRMLRAIRFSATLDFEIESQTLAAISALAPRVESVAVERVIKELGRTFTEGNATKGLKLLIETGILPVVLPEARVDRFPEVLTAVAHLTMAELTTMLALLLDGLSAEPARVTAERLRLSKAEREQLVYLLSNLLEFDQDRSEAESLRFIRHADWRLLESTHRALRTARNESTARADELAQLLAATPPERLNPPRLVDGRDLKSMGLKPGPQFKQMLDGLEDAQLEGRVSTRDEAEAFIRQLADSLAPTSP